MARSLRHAVVALSTTAAMACFTSALAQENASDEEQSAPNEEPGRHVAVGVLPQLGVALRLPEDFRLYDPQGPRSPDEHIEYERALCHPWRWSCVRFLL